MIYVYFHYFEFLLLTGFNTHYSSSRDKWQDSQAQAKNNSADHWLIRCTRTSIVGKKNASNSPVSFHHTSYTLQNTNKLIKQ